MTTPTLVAPPAPTPAAADETRITRPWDRRRKILTATAGGFLVATIWSLPAVFKLNRGGLIDGLGHGVDFISRCFPANFEHLDRYISLAWDTFLLAIVGTTLAVVASIPIAFLAAANTTPHRAVALMARGLIVFCRAVPDLVFALIFLAALRTLGPVPGALALAAHSIGMVGKLFADAIEEIDEGPRDAMLSAGASPLRAIVAGVIPQVLPSFASTALYRLEINVRTSVVLGFVGGGGIGFELQTVLGSLRYRSAIAIVAVIAVMIIVIERVSTAIRSSLLSGGGERRSWRRAHTPVPWTSGGEISLGWSGPRALRAGAAAAALALIVYASVDVGIGPATLVRALVRSWEMGGKLFPPDWSIMGDASELMLETVKIGLVATVIGLLFAFPAGLLAARNVAPARWLCALGRYVLVLIRALPELVLALIFVSAFGLGPFAGGLALAVATVGFGGKLFADSLEQADPGPAEAVMSTGARRSQRTAAATVVQSTPALVGTSLYLFDVNVRSSTILGLVGAGGIGFNLSESIRHLRYPETGTYLLLIFAVVLAIELISAGIRRLLI